MDPVALPVKDLLPVLSFCREFVAEKDIVPAFKNLYFSGDTIRGFSGTVGVIAKLPWKVSGKFGLPAVQTVKIFSSMADQKIETANLKVTEKTVELKGGAFKSRLQLPQVDDAATAFVTRELPTKKKATAVNPEWWTGVERVMFTVSMDESKPQLRGVYWGPEGRLISTDSMRISALTPAKDSLRSPLPKGLLLPDHLLSRIGSRRGTTKELILDEGQLWAVLPDYSVYGSLLEAEFPAQAVAGIIDNVRAQVKSKTAAGTWVTLEDDPAHLDIIMARLLIFADPPSFPVEVEVRANAVVVRVSGKEGNPATAEETLKAKTQGGAGYTCTANALFLREAFQRATSFWGAPPSAETAQPPLYFLSADRRLEHLVTLMAK